MSDLDLLVDPARTGAAARALEASGLTPLSSEARHHRRFLCRPVNGQGPGVPVELHHHLFDRPHPFSIDPARLLAERVEVPLPRGGALPVLAPAAAWLHVAAHFAWSDAGAGPVERTVEDLVRLGEATGLAPEALLAEGRAWRVLEPVAQVFALVEEARGPFQDPRLAAVASSGGRPRGLALRLLRGRIARGIAEPDHPERRGSATLARALLAPGLLAGASQLLAGVRRYRSSHVL